MDIGYITDGYRQLIKTLKRIIYKTKNTAFIHIYKQHKTIYTTKNTV